MRTLIHTALIALTMGGPLSVSAAEVPAAPTFKDTSTRSLALGMGRKLHKHVVVDPRANFMVDIGDLDPTEMTYAQLLSVLYIHNLTMVELKDLLKLIPLDNARQYPSPVVPWDNIRTPDDQVISVVLPVSGQSAPMLVAILRPLMPTNANLAVSTDLNTLVFSDTSANIRRIIEIIKAMEKLPGRPIQADAANAKP
jgi:general secretion pathway protein D